MTGSNGASATGNGVATTESSGVAARQGTRFVHTGDINDVWSHARKHGQQGFTCLYCSVTYNGGAATRLREHLSGLGNQVKPCDHVPAEVRDAMRTVRMERMMNKKEVKKRIARFERDLLQELHCHESIDLDLYLVAIWWHQYGGEVKILQKYAMWIVSQCVSSSGCERNWSTFALIHTKVRNRLSYEKLHKLVYAHYNLKLRIQEHEIEREEKELDPCSMIMDAMLFDETNPMMDWLNNCMSETNPVLDEGDHPSQVIVEEIDKEEESLKRKLCDLVKKQRKTRKVSSLTRKSCYKKGKKTLLNEEDEFVDSEDDADTDNELPSQETNDDQEERDGEEEGDCREESDEDNRDDAKRRSKRGNMRKQDPNSVYY